jgi:hypothetical protein
MLRRHWMTACCLALAAVAGCGRDDARDTGATGGAGTATAAPAAERLEVQGIRLGNAIGADKAVTTETDDFKPTETIYAVVSTRGTAPSATLRAVWTYQDGQVVDEQTQTIAPTGAANTEFHVSKPSGWPTGEYKVEVFLDGRSVGTKDFDVKK